MKAGQEDPAVEEVTVVTEVVIAEEMTAGEVIVIAVETGPDPGQEEIAADQDPEDGIVDLDQVEGIVGIDLDLVTARITDARKTLNQGPEAEVKHLRQESQNSTFLFRIKNSINITYTIVIVLYPF